MTLNIQIPGITSSGPRIYRVKTDGPGTLRTFDFKNPLTYPSTVSSPTTSIPNGTFLSDLPDASVGTPNHPATMVGSTVVQSAGGGLKLASGTWSNVSNALQLPSDFCIPALSGADGHYLIILGYKPGTVATNGSTISAIAGWSSATSSANNNWTVFRNANSANTFVYVGGAFANCGVLTVAPHRIAIEMVKLGTAGTIQANVYVDGILQAGSSPVAQAALAQPTGSFNNALLGGCAYGVNQDAAAEYESITIRNLALDTMSVTDIIAADMAAWGGTSRFS